MKATNSSGGSIDEAVRSLSAVEIEEIKSLWHEAHAEQLIKAFYKTKTLDEWKSYLELNPPSPETIALVIVMAVEKHQSRIGRVAANAMHSKPGGHRDKRETIRQLWASGKYADRDTCAEQECGAINMSFSTARKALHNTPDPDPWHAKRTKKPNKRG